MVTVIDDDIPPFCECCWCWFEDEQVVKSIGVCLLDSGRSGVKYDSGSEGDVSDGCNVDAGDGVCG